ncbi:hypothetical protein [Fulvivirga lutimaris]|nr:hypothetical protein [Fulvivirga lutimaris]
MKIAFPPVMALSSAGIKYVFVGQKTNKGENSNTDLPRLSHAVA